MAISSATQQRRRSAVVAIGLLAACVGQAMAGDAFLRESAREIPIAAEVDVLVIGGSTGAVAAARAAADEGAEVFLITPRPYLGDDMCATLRLWLEPGEMLDTPLARKLFGGVPLVDAHAPILRAIYTTSRKASPKHPDSNPQSLLTDGEQGDPTETSVQYDGDVDITLDLGTVKSIAAVRLAAHDRRDAEPAMNYIIDRVRVDVSEDGETWETHAMAAPESPARTYTLEIRCEATARYVRVSVVKQEDADRLLLSEVQVLGTQSADDASDSANVQAMPSPLHVKRTLDEALLASGVSFLYGCYATDRLVDRDGRDCGVVMANRAGRQAIVAKCVLVEDATHSEGDPHRIVIGGRVPNGPVEIDGLGIATPSVVGYVDPEGRTGGVYWGDNASRRQPTPPGAHPIVDYTIRLATGISSDAEREQAARDLTYQKGQVRAAERLFDRGARVFDISTETRRNLPVARCTTDAIRLGMPAGREAAAFAIGRPRPQSPVVAGKYTALTSNEKDIIPGDTREVLRGPRPTSRDLPTVPSPERNTPLDATYDVVVIGGGTSGAPAGIAAARSGAKTLVVEYQEGLGGVGTLGLIGRYHYGNLAGFTAEVPPSGGEERMEWLRRELRKAGADIRFGCLGCGVIMDGGRVTGVVIVDETGRRLVPARVVIDATGAADLAGAAGADVITIDEHDIAMQGAGYPPRKLGAAYTNTDFLLIDDADMLDTMRVLVDGKRKYGDAYDVGTFLQTRERPRVVGDHILSYVDQMAGRTYPDSICFSHSNYDSHGYPSHPIFSVVRPPRPERPSGGSVYTPYRCLLPRGIEGMLVIGIGTSAERDAMALIRMQGDLQNQGYAAGLAAAMAVESELTPREVDIDRLREMLVDIGNLPAESLEHEDSFPMPKEAIAAAADRFQTDGPTSRDAAILFAHPSDGVELIRSRFANASGERRVDAAIFLGLCGDATGVETLISELNAAGDWEPKKPLGSMAEFSQLPTRTDAIARSLALSGDRRALEPLLRKAETLDSAACLSHHRAMALALATIGDPAAAEVLADVLEKPGMRGYARTSLDDHPSGTRIEPLREIMLARALYLCGDHDGLGEAILREYADDLRGLLSRHATAVLESANRER